MPVPGTLLPDPYGTTRDSVYLGEPGLPSISSPQYQIGYSFRHSWSTFWEFRQKARLTSYSVTGPIIFASLDGLDPTGLGIDGRTVTRSGFFYRGNSDIFSADNQIQGRFGGGPLIHDVLAGFDYLHYRSHTAGDGFDLAPIDLYAPVYGSPPASTGPLFDSLSKLKEWGAYAQYRVKFIDRWVGQVGVRRSEVTNTSISLPGGDRSDQPDHRITLSGGVMYVSPSGLSPYASYSESFEPQVGYDPLPGGAIPPPSLGKQTEFGLKWNDPTRHLDAAVALFELKRENIVNPDPANPGFSVLVGEQRHRGAEFELNLQPISAADLRFAYAYLDAEITHSFNGDQGLTPPNVPRHAASAFGTLAGTALGLPNGAISLGLRYTGTRRGEVPNVYLPSYVAADIGARYTIGRTEIGLNVKNAFDRHYYTGMLFGGVQPGEPRTLVGTVTVKAR